MNKYTKLSTSTTCLPHIVDNYANIPHDVYRDTVYKMLSTIDSPNHCLPMIACTTCSVPRYPSLIDYRPIMSLIDPYVPDIKRIEVKNI